MSLPSQPNEAAGNHLTPKKEAYSQYNEPLLRAVQNLESRLCQLIFRDGADAKVRGTHGRKHSHRCRNPRRDGNPTSSAGPEAC